MKLGYFIGYSTWNIFELRAKIKIKKTLNSLNNGDIFKLNLRIIYK